MEHKTWNFVKGKIIQHFGSISSCAATLQCSADGVRKAVSGQCPGIAARLKAALGVDWESNPEVRA